MSWFTKANNPAIVFVAKLVYAYKNKSTITLRGCDTGSDAPAGGGCCDLSASAASTLPDEAEDYEAQSESRALESQARSKTVPTVQAQSLTQGGAHGDAPRGLASSTQIQPEMRRSPSGPLQTQKIPTKTCRLPVVRIANEADSGPLH